MSASPELRRRVLDGRADPRLLWHWTDEEILQAIDEATSDCGEVVTMDGERMSDVAPASMIAACLWSGDPWGESAHPEYEAKLINRLLRLVSTGILLSWWQRNASGRVLGGGDERYRLYGRAA